jgi:hypothetical protein
MVYHISNDIPRKLWNALTIALRKPEIGNQSWISLKEPVSMPKRVKTIKFALIIETISQVPSKPCKGG